ncbi:MAG: DUF423 domain-containing protein [Pseudomonadota bacterium]
MTNPPDALNTLQSKPLNTIFLLLAGVSGLMSVAIAAADNHLLPDALAPGGQVLIDQAILFQLTHAICLLALFFTFPSAPTALKATLRLSAAGFAVGLLLFCLPIYWLAFHGPESLGPFSLLTPIGGTGFLIGWAGLSWAGLRYAATN